jgi:predicted LPLAT superfamily acyltransferase
MPSWQGKSRGNRLGYRIFVWILEKLGVWPAYFLLRFVAFYYFLFSRHSSACIYDYFRRHLGYGKLASLLGIYRNYYQFGQTLIDKVVIMTDIPNRFSFDFDGEENLRQMADLKRGGLLLSAHIGNWEIAGHLLKRINTRIHIVMYDGEEKDIKEYLESVTGERNARVIVVKDDLSHIYLINQALLNNEFVCLHADRYMENNKILETEFLGSNARFPAGPFILAATCRVPVSFVFAMKESSLRYHFFATGIKEYDPAGKNENIPRILREFKGAMEEKLKKYPEQWYNYYNFWQS